MKTNTKYKVILKVLLLTSGIFVFKLFAQNQPLKVKLISSYQFQNEAYKASSADGFGIGGQLNYSIWKGLDVSLNLYYDYMNLQQDDVLDEWEWDYWEQTYIDFLPGTEPEIVNETLRYTSTDSIYSAVFEPSQYLKELRLFVGFEYNFPLTKSIQIYTGAKGGFSLFYRELKMQEHWTKRFKLDSLSTEKFDYEFNYDLLHFAPTREGKILFITPSLGTRIYLSSSVDLDLGARYIYYLQRDELFGIKISQAAKRWFPIKSKTLLSIGLTFKY